MLDNSLLHRIRTHSTLIITGLDTSIFTKLSNEIKNKTTDCLVIKKTEDSKNLLVEDVSIMQSFVKNKSHTALYVITDKSIRNTVLQNKLLKMLEEASDNVFIIILQESSVYLLPTVISRCQVLYAGDMYLNKDTKDVSASAVDRKKVNLIKSKKYSELLKLLEIENAGVHGTITTLNVNDYTAL